MANEQDSEQEKNPETEVDATNTAQQPEGDTISIQVTEYQALKQALEEAKTNAEKQWDLAVRAKAEVENVQRRREKDVANAHKFGTEKLLNELLPVIDSLEQGLQSINSEDESQKGIGEGISLTLKMFSDVLAKFNVETIDPEGKQFDPSVHEAMSMLEQADVAPGTILQVIQKGYKLNERLVRPARVIVAKATSAKVDETA